MRAQRRLAVLYATVFVDQLGFGIVLPFLPLYADRLGASALEAGLLLAIYSLVQGAVSTRWGRLSDRIGRRPVIVASALGGCIGFTVLSAADSLALLFAGRALLGAFGVGMPTAQAWIADTTPREQRGRALALLGAVGVLGFVAGPALGALGVTLAGMRVPFVISAVCAGANAILAATLLPAAPAVASRTGGRVPGAWRAIAPCLVLAFVLTYAFSNIEATFSLFTKDELAFSPAENGWMFIEMGCVAALTQAVGMRWLASWLDEPGRVALGVGLLAVGAAVLPLTNALGLVLVIAAMAIGYATAAPSLLAWASRRAPPNQQGELIGLTQSAGALARVAGPVMGGLLFDHVGRGAPFWCAAGLLAGVVVLALVARRA
jgi:MFS family permease